MTGPASTSATPSVSPASPSFQPTLDAHVREIVAFHFSEETGTPFWLDFRKKLDFDPVAKVRSFDDLKLLGFFQDEWLRCREPRIFVPRAFKDKPISIFETGGSTGIPKSRINVNDFRYDYEAYSATLPDTYFPKGADWLEVGPSGPRRLRLAIEHLAQFRGGMCYMVDLDPRFVIKLIKWGEMAMMERYKNHVIEQALTLIKAHPSIKCLFITPKLLEALCERISLERSGITGVFCGGTEMTPQFHRFAVEELCGPTVFFAPTYGNTLMGLAVSKPRIPADKYALIYYPPAPRAIVEVLDPRDPSRTVAYGETGRVCLTTLTHEFFMPRFLERDMGEREAPYEGFPYDGVRNVRPFAELNATVVEGVY